MRRRDLIAAAGGAAFFRPFAGAAQQPAKVPTVGVLDVADPAPFLSVFRDALRALGYLDGQNIRLEIRSASGDPRQVRSLADQLVRLKVDVIVARLNLATSAAKAATQTIPIVMVGAGAPLETGLVASLANPGGNVTGTSLTSAELGGKRLQLIREMLPSLRRIAILGNANDAFTKPFVAEIESAGRTLGVAVEPIIVNGADEFAAAFTAMDGDHAEAVVMQGSLPTKPMVALALEHRIAPFATSPAAVAAGALMSYSGSWSQAYREAAAYVDKILQGAKPADLPVEQPTEFELVINVKTAKALGLTVPQSLLQRADEVIE